MDERVSADDAQISLTKINFIVAMSCCVLQLSNGKGAGTDFIPAEIYKSGVTKIREDYQTLLQIMDQRSNKVSHLTIKMH